MELQPLDETFQPKAVLENYNSLIWTERYSTFGDFELQSSDIAACIKAMPRGSYVTLRDTTVPMIVEDHKIVKAPNAAPLVVVTGRTFESVLDRRGSINRAFPHTSVYSGWTVLSDKHSDAAFLVMRTVLGDIAQVGLPALNPAVSPLDAIPELLLVPPVDFSALTTNKFVIATQDLYKTVTELIQTNRHGIKSTRPVQGSSHPGQVAVEIYNGANLTDVINFDARFDQFDSSTYFLSARGSTNVGYVLGANGGEIVLKTLAPEPSGLARRVLVVNQTTDTATTNPDVRRSRGLIELYKNNATALFDGEAAQQVAEGYNRDYYLGDILKLVGEYGLTANVRVAEFIRSSDASGEKAFPTFETIEAE